MKFRNFTYWNNYKSYWLRSSPYTVCAWRVPSPTAAARKPTASICMPCLSSQLWQLLNSLLLYFGSPVDSFLLMFLYLALLKMPTNSSFIMKWSFFGWIKIVDLFDIFYFLFSISEYLCKCSLKENRTANYIFTIFTSLLNLFIWIIQLFWLYYKQCIFARLI